MNIKNYKIEKGPQGYTAILYIDEGLSEFGKEFCLEMGRINTDKIEKLTKDIKQYIDEKFPSMMINTVKVMAGGILLATIPIAGSQAFAMDSANIQSNITASQSEIVYETYTVEPGDSLWLISQKYNISVQNIKQLNNLTTDTIYVGQELKIKPLEQQVDNKEYIVQLGDTLWIIANKNNTSISELKNINQLTGDMIYVGQRLKLPTVYQEAPKSENTYIVKSGDSLWKIANDYNTTVGTIQEINNLTNTTIYVGQSLIIPTASQGVPKPVEQEITYVVQGGDTVSGIAQKFNISTSDLLKYNYMGPDEWFSAGQKIYISGYAPRDYAVTPGEAQAPARSGTLVDWYRDGQYVLKRGDVFTIVDVDTGTQFQVQMMGGYNHSDIEPVTAKDTAIMKELFGTWQWTPRAVVIYKDGMNIAGSLSGQPHSFDTVTGNNVEGHFDLYLLNSAPHSGTTSDVYLQQHKDMVYKASGVNQ